MTKRRCQRRRFAEVDLPMAEIEAAAAAASAARSLQVGALQDKIESKSC